MSKKFAADLENGLPHLETGELKLGEIWARFYSIFQLWQLTKLLPPAAEFIFYSPIWILMEAR